VPGFTESRKFKKRKLAAKERKELKESRHLDVHRHRRRRQPAFPSYGIAVAPGWVRPPSPGSADFLVSSIADFLIGRHQTALALRKFIRPADQETEAAGGRDECAASKPSRRFFMFFCRQLW